MRAQTKIWISIAASLAVSAVMAYFAFSLMRDMSNDFAQYQRYSKIINEAFALNSLIDDALNQESSARKIQQIGQVRRTLSKALDSISSSNSREESLIRQIRRNNQELGPLIEQLFEQKEGAGGSIGTERRTLLASQLWVKVRFITDDVNRLMETSGTRVVAAQTKTGLIILILIGVAILTNTLIYFFSSRSIVRAQEELRESQRQGALLADLVELSSQPFGTGGPDGRMGMCNPAFPRLLGYSKEEFLALNWGKDLTPPEWLEKEAAIIEELHRTGQPVRYEKEYWRKDGTRVPVELLVHLRRGEQGEPSYYYAFVTDITERKRAEEALQESREDLNRAQAVAHAGSWRLNVQKNELTWSDENHRIFGIPRGTPMTYETFLGSVHPEDREYVDREWMAALKGEPYDIEHRIIVDGAVKWVRERAELEFNPKGQLLGGFGTTQDITELKQAEEKLKRTLADLERSNQELGEFAYISSHDLQEPLRKIANFSDMLVHQYQGRLDEQAERYFGYITDGAKRMQTLINDLLAYSQVGRAEMSLVPASLEEILKGTLGDLQALIHESGVEISHDPLPVLQVNPHQMGRLLQNLITNAIKFHDHKSPRIHFAARQEGQEWVISVRDNGIGFDAQYAENIFKVFKRLHVKEHYPGTGIGLAICKKIVERHGGRIWAESKPGRGSTFYFTIPA